MRQRFGTPQVFGADSVSQLTQNYTSDGDWLHQEDVEELALMAARLQAEILGYHKTNSFL
jgi:hypothetical protein